MISSNIAVLSHTKGMREGKQDGCSRHLFLLLFYDNCHRRTLSQAVMETVVRLPATPTAPKYAQLRPATTGYFSCNPPFAGCRDVWGSCCDKHVKRSTDSRPGRVRFQSFLVFRNTSHLSLRGQRRVLCLLSHVPGLDHLTVMDESTALDSYQCQLGRTLFQQADLAASPRYSSSL